jgi:UDP-N-acetylmuramate: L-alanyl-gamma-D-glutamyl-meso-diaminopimelate ligase
MENKDQSLDIYIMGIGGTAMGAFAGLLQEKGHRVRGSDKAVYSPMREKLAEWQIPYKMPYSAENLSPRPDLVIVGNVIRKDNPEAIALRDAKIPFLSFPEALNKLFLHDACPIVASGTHGKTTCTSLLAHCLFHAKKEPGFLVGGIPINFGQSFRLGRSKGAFVIEGDEYDSAYFDKGPKFLHYDPKLLLVTSLEYDHADIYPDIKSIIEAFAKLFALMDHKRIILLHNHEENIEKALTLAKSTAQVLRYGKGGDFEAHNEDFHEHGINYDVYFQGKNLGPVFIPLFGQHNLANSLGVYGILHLHGLTHTEICAGFKSFLGVKRRLEERFKKNGVVIIDDFAHHPSAVRETIKATRQKYPSASIWALFEPRSATTCMPIFEDDYSKAFLEADKVFLAPLGRSLEKDRSLNTEKIATALRLQGISAQAFDNYAELRESLHSVPQGVVLLCMSNGDFSGLFDFFAEKYGSEKK